MKLVSPNKKKKEVLSYRILRHILHFKSVQFLGLDKAKEGPTEGAGTYIGYVHHMTANKKLINAKDLFYQLGFQKGVSGAEIENAAIEQYKVAADKQVGYFFLLLLFSVFKLIYSRRFLQVPMTFDSLWKLGHL